MDEVVTTTDTTPTGDVQTDTTESYINSDLTYKEGWKESLLPEELRGEKFYDSPFNKDVKELLKTAGNQAKALGKKGIVPINENSSEFEVSEWRKAHDVPGEYIYQKPTDLKTIELSDEFVAKTLSGLNKANLSQGQFDTVMNIFHDFWKDKEIEYDLAEKAEVNEINQRILTEENTDYETNTQFIDNAVRQFTQEWPTDDVQKLFGTVDSKGGINSKDHVELKPLFRRYLANVGKSMGEHRVIGGDLSGKSIQQQLDEVMNSPEYLTGFGKPHQEAINKALKLREQLNKS